MKNLFCACTFSVVASTAFAGGYDEPIIQPEIVMTETVKSAGSDEWVLVLMTLLTVGLGVVK
jgi:hypothetical protein